MYCTEKFRFMDKRVREISRFFCAATRVRPCRLARLTDSFIQKSLHLSNCTLQHREIPSRPPTIVIRVQVFLPIILDSSSHTSDAFPTTTRPPSQSARPFPFISRFLPCPNWGEHFLSVGRLVVKCVSKVLGQLSDSCTSYISSVTISASALREDAKLI